MRPTRETQPAPIGGGCGSSLSRGSSLARKTTGAGAARPLARLPLSKTTHLASGKQATTDPMEKEEPDRPRLLGRRLGGANPGGFTLAGQLDDEQLGPEITGLRGLDCACM